MWLTLSVQEFVKNYLLENMVTTAVAFIIRASLRPLEKVSCFQKPKSLPLSLPCQDILPAPSCHFSLCHTSVPVPASRSATHAHLLPLTPVVIPGWPEECESMWWMGLNMALFTARQAWGELLSFSASVT